MRSVITGGAGFIGSHLAEYLLELGDEVVVVDDFSTGAAANLEVARRSRSLQIIDGSVLDRELLESAFRGAARVFHLAAAVGVRLIVDEPLNGLRVNIHGTENVLDACVATGAAPLLASTSEIYGKNTADRLGEDADRILGSPLVARWTYAAAKGIDEAFAHGYWHEYGLPVRIVAYRGIVGNVSFADPVSWLRFLNPRIAKIICVAEAVRRYFLEMRPAFLRIPADRLVTIHKGHSLDWYREPPADLAALGIPHGAFVVGCVANYRPRKGIDLLVDAVARLPRSLNVHLLLVGDMSAPRLTEAIERSGAADRVHRVGYRADAPALAAACDVFALPSTRREGLARSLIEAMAYGVAPVVTDCGGSPELVIDGQSGLIVPPGDAGALAAALARLHDDPELRGRLGSAARERIRRDFRIEDTIERTIGVYERVLAE